MHIAHSNITSIVKPTKFKRLTKQAERVGVWVARQYQKDYDSAIKKHEASILEIQKSIPGWMPTKSK